MNQLFIFLIVPFLADSKVWTSNNSARMIRIWPRFFCVFLIYQTTLQYEMFKLISKFLKRSPRSKLEPACESELILKLSYDELRLIFDFLSLKERVKCRRVCKAFRSVVDSIRTRELFVFDEWSHEEVTWFDSGRPVHSKNSITVDYVKFAFLSRGLRIFGDNLKFLSLKCQMWTSNLNCLSWLVQLEELWILRVYCLSIHGKVTLRLPKLKKLAFSVFKQLSSKNCVLLLDTPSLEDVRVERNLQWVQFKFGTAVKSLQIDRCEQTNEMLDQFMELKNLERFSCTDPVFLDAFDILKFKPDLKRIDCHHHESGKQVDVIEKLLRQKAKWSLPVEIYLDGLVTRSIWEGCKIELENVQNDFWKIKKGELMYEICPELNVQIKKLKNEK